MYVITNKVVPWMHNYAEFVAEIARKLNISDNFDHYKLHSAHSTGMHFTKCAIAVRDGRSERVKKKHFTLFSLWKCADTQMHQLTEIKQRNVCHIRKVCMRNSMRCNSADIIDNRRCQGTIPINMSNLTYWNSQRAIIFIHNKCFSANHVPRRSNPSNSTIIHFSANFRRYRIRRVLRLIQSIAITSHVRRTYS